MNCLRCGYCCKNYVVTIVDDPDIGYDPMSEDNLIVHEGGGPCKHLIGDTPGEYSCAVHGKSWYPETPCYEFRQIGKPGAACRMGKFVLGRLQKGGEECSDKGG